MWQAGSNPRVTSAGQDQSRLQAGSIQFGFYEPLGHGLASPFEMSDFDLFSFFRREQLCWVLDSDAGCG